MGAWIIAKSVGQWCVGLLGGVRATIFFLACLFFLAQAQFYKHEALRIKAEWAKANTALIVANARANQMAAEIAKARQEAAALAAQAARNRNDTEIPRIRSESQARAGRAATADAAQRVLDVQAALDSYGAAADSVRGTLAQ